MSYQALYRQWRPQTFGEIVGQEYICRILQNALKMGRIGHAYLFCGPRGTGKTSTAKILAKAVNCMGGPGEEPCNQCSPCQQITQGAFLDVLEIDGASNRGIDEIRELRERVRLAPAEGRYKVYIIDEVHMLTTEAFNALLKTLEEPPAHVIFIFATTEAHKIPLTILSRCQRFDFRRLSTETITAHLVSVADKLAVEIEKRTLNLLARKAEGSLRDALSLLDQCISLAGGIAHEDVLAVLGLTAEESLAKIVEALAAKDVALVLKVLNQLLDQGQDPRQFIKELVSYFRNILMLKVAPGDNGLVETSTDHKRVLLQQAVHFTPEQLLNVIQLLAKAEDEVRWSSQPRVVLEVMLIRLLQVLEAAAVPTGERVAAKEKKEGSPAPTPAAPAGPASAPPPVTPKPVAPQPRGEAQSPFDDLRRHWPRVLAELRKTNVPAASLLGGGKLASWQKDIITIAFTYEVHKDIVMEKHREEIEKTLARILQRPLQIRCVLIEDKKKEDEDHKQPSLLQAAIEIFGEERVKEI